MIMRLGFHKTRYFFNAWNLMDFVLVWMSVLDNWVLLALGFEGGLKAFSSMRALRMLRLVRLVRLLRMFKELALLCMGLLESFKTLFWVGLLMLVWVYVFALFFTKMIGKEQQYYNKHFEALGS